MSTMKWILALLAFVLVVGAVSGVAMAGTPPPFPTVSAGGGGPSGQTWTYLDPPTATPSIVATPTAAPTAAPTVAPTAAPSVVATATAVPATATPDGSGGIGTTAILLIVLLIVVVLAAAVYFFTRKQ
jgi:hypothetical protein